MSTSALERLFYMAVELRPDLPNTKLMGLLGKTWGPIIRAGAEHGLAGAAAALPKVSVDQLSSFYMAGADSGATPDLDEFRAALAGRIYDSICGNDSISQLDQIKLAGSLGSWFDGISSAVGDSEMDWDAEVATPPFTKSGFWPLDQIHGSRGIPQGISTVLGAPGAGKTTIALALGIEWRRQNIGPVIMMQTEIPPSPLMMKISEMVGDEKLFRPGIDRIVFGPRNCQQKLERIIENPDPDTLLIFDSITGMCGQGESSESRTRYANLFHDMRQAANVSRMAFMFHHLKRGIDIADQESGAGSRVVEQMSDNLFCLRKDDSPRPDGLSGVKIEALKLRYNGSIARPINFTFDYVKGRAYEGDPLDDMMEELE